MNIFLNEYFGFWFELNFELNHFWAKFNEKMNFQNVSNRARALSSRFLLLVGRLFQVVSPVEDTTVECFDFIQAIGF